MFLRRGTACRARQSFLAVSRQILYLRRRHRLMWSAAACRRCLPSGLAGTCCNNRPTEVAAIREISTFRFLISDFVNAWQVRKRDACRVAALRGRRARAALDGNGKAGSAVRRPCRCDRLSRSPSSRKPSRASPLRASCCPPASCAAIAEENVHPDPCVFGLLTWSPPKVSHFGSVEQHVYRPCPGGRP